MEIPVIVSYLAVLNSLLNNERLSDSAKEKIGDSILAATTKLDGLIAKA